ncbi:TetR/AcrR family transcriptional regulator [Saccharothrix coeruleofusca]|uniref:TetR family transcriptional regulator n=1 Tax=Saccharothrix coeruleofusca TaxID=33919 RepID=A0A918APQ4_9PSEU|nr:TetR/AcrR family transcriptional regulator [Saccharothrix coeruleofusca]MBP2334924.1 AcrR family transcriptional regulator [Saccharothrix coeruleofusca]GGP67970.1 TetR family transcriptional regulator [Saccharothrix coeruleofusca]
MDTPRQPTTLWDRSRQAVVAEIVDTALALFTEHGYEAVTVGQIAKQAGVSQRSLFRYFGTKEDLVCGDQDGLGQLLVSTVEAQPAGMSPWDALRAGFAAIASAEHTSRQVLEITTLIFDNPPLRSRYHEKRLKWQAALVPVIEARMGIEPGPTPDPRAVGVIAAVFACVDAASELWVRQGGKADPFALYDQMIAAVRG